jgi:hypothetical protein
VATSDMVNIVSYRAGRRGAQTQKQIILLLSRQD